LRIPVAHEVAGGDGGLVVERGDFVGGEHRLHHVVVAVVGVERADNPVAPAPDLRRGVPHVWHLAATKPIAVTPHVHPVPRPALAVARVAQEPVHDALVGVGCGVGEEGVQLLACGRQAEEVEVNAAEECGFVGGRERGELRGGEWGGDEGVD